MGAAPSTPGLRSALAADFRTAPALHRLALIGVSIWMAYEWGPGNETMTPWIVARVIDDETRAVVIVWSAVIGFTLTAVQQLVAGLTGLVAFSLFERTTAAAVARLDSPRAVRPVSWAQRGFGAKCVLAFGLGSTAVALLEVVATGRNGVRTHLPTVARSAVLTATIVATIGAAAATLAVTGRSIGPLAGPTNRVVTVLASPWFWLGAVALMLVANLLRRAANHQRLSQATDLG